MTPDPDTIAGLIWLVILAATVASFRVRA